MTTTKTPRQDIYSRITDQIVGALEQGVKPWTQPWNAAHAAGPVTRPLRFNGEGYSGINVLTLWASAMDRGFAAPIWMTFKQARRTGRPCPQGRERIAGCLRQHTRPALRLDETTGEEIDQSPSPS